MRQIWRLDKGAKPVYSITMLGLLLTLSSCSLSSLPDRVSDVVTIDKLQKREEAAGNGFSSKDDPRSTDKTYLATVHIHITETMQPITFDVRRNRADVVSFSLMESQQQTAYVHLGYDHTDGGIVGLRYAFHF